MTDEESDERPGFLRMDVRRDGAGLAGAGLEDSGASMERELRADNGGNSVSTIANFVEVASGVGVDVERGIGVAGVGVDGDGTPFP